MKKMMLLGVSSMLLASSANATVSRLKALGNTELDSEGSYYFEDSRNIFLNPAKAMNYGDTVMLEWGSKGKLLSGDSTTNSTVVSDEEPKAQGGFLKKSGNSVYGLYLGNESNTSSQLRALASSQAAVAFGVSAGSTSTPYLLDTSDNQLDLFYAWESGMKYGVNFLYTKSEDKRTQKEEDEAMAIRFGVDAGKWDGHINLSLKSEAKETYSDALGYTHEFDGKLGLHVGGSYELGNGRIYGYYKTFKWDQKDDYNWTTNPQSVGTTGKTGTTEGEFNTIHLGWGSVMKTDNGKVFTKVYFEKKEIELQLADKAEVNLTIVPVTFGYEAKATDWLTLRGSVIHNLHGKKDNKNYTTLNSVAKSLAESAYGTEGKGTIDHSTVVNAGASLTFGGLSIDGFVGTTAGSRTGTTGNKEGILSTDNLLTRVGMTYNF